MLVYRQYQCRRVIAKAKIALISANWIHTHTKRIRIIIINTVIVEIIIITGRARASNVNRRIRIIVQAVSMHIIPIVVTQKPPDWIEHSEDLMICFAPKMNRKKNEKKNKNIVYVCEHHRQGTDLAECSFRVNIMNMIVSVNLIYAHMGSSHHHKQTHTHEHSLTHSPNTNQPQHQIYIVCEHWRVVKLQLSTIITNQTHAYISTISHLLFQQWLNLHQPNTNHTHQIYYINTPRVK